MTRQVYKPLGMSPLATIDALRRQDNSLRDATVGYAGRLDPMAEGLLLLLIGDENGHRKDFERLPKSYEFSVLFGCTTDTYDTLGIVEDCSQNPFMEETLLKKLKTFSRSFRQSYPPYSAIRVQGHPLFWWARQNRLDEIEIPSRTVTIDALSLTEKRTISGADLLEETTRRTYLVTGDFRQEAIRISWSTALSDLSSHAFPLLSFTVSGSNGLYVRSLARRMGELVGLPSLAFSIKRTRIGDFMVDTAERLK